MNSYEKHVLQGALAGLVTGFIVGFLAFMLVSAELIEELVGDVIRAQIPPEVPPSEVEAIIEDTKRFIRSLTWLTPLTSTLQYTLIGTLLGLVKGALRYKLKFSEAASALLTEFIYISLISAIYMVLLLQLGDLLKYGVLVVLNATSGLTFTILLLLFSVRKGPWSRITNAKPKIV